MSRLPIKKIVQTLEPLLGSVALLMVCSVVVIPSNADAVGDIEKSRQTAITRAIEKVGPTVASINVIQIKELRPYPFFNDPFFEFWFPEEFYRQRVKSLGSGVVISPDGYVMTNEHVVQGAERVLVTLPGGKEYDAEIVGMDKATDLALLKIDDKNLPHAKLGNSDDIIIGEWVVALGNPFGLFDINKQPTATIGIVSAVKLNFGKEYSGRIYQEMIQTDASINRGNSGGPLCNANGEVIGISTFIFTGGNSDGSIGIGFAIPINRAREIAEELKRYGKVDRSFTTGLSVQRVDRSLAKYLDLPKVRGVIVTDIKPRSSAEKSGLRIGDVILTVNDQEVNSKDEVLRIIEENFLRAGDKIKITYYRDGQQRKTYLKLSRR